MRLGRTVDEGTVGLSGDLVSGLGYEMSASWRPLPFPLGQSFGQKSEFRESQTDLPILQRAGTTSTLPKKITRGDRTKNGGEAGIRTLDTRFNGYTRFRGELLQPLGHLSVCGSSHVPISHCSAIGWRSHHFFQVKPDRHCVETIPWSVKNFRRLCLSPTTPHSLPRHVAVSGHSKSVGAACGEAGPL